MWKPSSHFKFRILLSLLVSLLGASIITITLYIIFSYLKVYAFLDEHQTFMIICFIFLFFLFIIFSKLLEINFTSIKQIINAINQMADGEFDIAIPIEQDDELGYIAHHLNLMARQLRIAKNKEKKSIEKERLANLARREEEKNKNELITNVAHDLRTPLTSMIGYLQLLVENPQLDEKTKEQYLQIAYDKSKRLNRLMNDLFDYASLSDNEIKFQKTRLNISELVRQIADEFYPVFESKHLHLNMEISSPSLYIDGDGNLLARVFDNLISNAIKYGKDGEDIDIIVSHDDLSVTIKIINSGTLSREELDHLFEKFYRTDESRSSSTGGTGLGLAISKSIIEMHEGEIFAVSRHHKTSLIIVLKRAVDLI